MLLEREQPLAELADYLAGAAAGQGRMVLLAGEAGVGKTSVALAFCANRKVDLQAWWGACDGLLTPSPLEPLHDIARQSGGELARLLAGDHSRQAIFGGLLDALRSPLRPVVLVIEDVHWADEATLDLLVFLGRRVAASNAVVIASYRDDEVGPEHPLRVVLGRLAGLPQVRRIELACLSAEATATLVAGHQVDPATAYRVTGGNPFFVTELLAAPPGEVPGTVRDAVLARASRLSSRARAALEAVAVLQERVELSLVAAVTGDPDPAAVIECERAGVLRVAGRTVGFRHELARQAVEQAIPPASVPDLHAAALAQLADRPGANPARMAYHARRAHDPQAVLAHAPVAAAQASRLGAHRDALTQYRVAVEHAGQLSAPERAELLEAYAGECRLAGRIPEGGEAIEQAVALRREAGEPDALARAMVHQAHFLYMSGRTADTYQQVAEAVALAGARPPSAPLAAVYAYAAHLHMVAHDHAAAQQAATRAIALIDEFPDPSLRTTALVALGSTLWDQDPEQAEKVLSDAVTAAHASGRSATLINATGFLGASALDARRYPTADRWLAEVVRIADRFDLEAPRDFYRAGQAGSHFEQGRWPQADAVLAPLVAPQAKIYPPAAALARRIAARLAVRRGEPSQREPLRAAWEQVAATGDGQRMWPVAAARAEAAWHAGQAAQIPELVEDAYRAVSDQGSQWAVGELAFWLWRAGVLTTPPERAAAPYALHIQERWEAAAATWEAVGCPYEAAVARADSDDPDELRAALETFYRLGARPAANRLVHRMRNLGITDLPRRPHRSTGANPGGLTDRELEVLRLLPAGLSNADIAARLHISPRTAGHHVSAIMSKLGVGTRQDAAAAASQLDTHG